MGQRLLRPENRELLRRSRLKARAIPERTSNLHAHQPFGYASVFGLEATCGRCGQTIVRPTIDDTTWRTEIVIQEWP